MLFIDSGYACYRPEMLTLFRRLVPNFDARKKTILITHADVDHCGLLPEFGELSYNASVTVTGITTTTSDGHQWYRIKYKGITAYVRADLLSDKKDSTVTPGGSTGNGGGTVSGSGTASEIANFAMSFIGYSYVWGGKSPSAGFDCSGLMYYVLTNYGYKMNRVANDQMSQGTYVSRSDLQVGDLVFFGYGNYANHVGMYIGGGNFVHASTPSTGVRINSLDESYYKTRFLCGRRII